MNYKLEVDEKLRLKFLKIKKKDKLHSEIIKRKINHILENPYQFKPLRNEMAGIRRVHIGKSFVLTYEILENDKTIKLLDYDHHDKIFK
ncbi:type II toxin-antitoxin system mRNA interferase toxin, RelE/StbE family [Candidatus Pacearchaeota archaeon]|nr:type II toxin-antitoxin system mRNA interferase toxin, RelE/StbE family [Candidatus Pacearchaeota archaeon]|tara:strand:- start:3186 stop:3452 length:267 start_codon:yes stop_codon:yes gene_type:complete